ncbi:MAG: hypothetical protein R6U32_00945 [Candidatus Woesearchaeota archaeon]
MNISRLVETITPSRRIRTPEDFWERYKDSISSEVEGGADRSILEPIVKENYEAYGKEYFSQKPNMLRYGALALSALGAYTAGSAILALSSGGPIESASGISLGLTGLNYGAVLGTLADIYDSSRAQKASEGKLRKRSLKETLSTPFESATYRSIYRNALQFGEGIGWRAIATWGAHRKDRPLRAHINVRCCAAGLLQGEEE